MPNTTRCALLIVASALLITSCSSSKGSTGHQDNGNKGAVPPASAPAGGSSSGPSGGSLPTGPGPQPAYRVQQQPPAGSCHYRYEQNQPLPDPSCTPGALNPKVTQATLASTICRSGYTSDIRPPLNITSREKDANAKSYGYTQSLHDAEYDHLVSLELGGDPNDARNLWVEPPSPGHTPGSGPNNDKDRVEARLHSAICKNQVTLAAAQQAIAHDWTTAEQALGIDQKNGSKNGQHK
ncbi:hypothetical protein [Streptantibioticus ferralitis]|uniref:HNH endonuclease n=1 Tax=Streptantibioticus ferralitis TaxID=236510 RepID=A0ABT5YTG4_9ACTN|nr:hypothetical protein [Streptantibioticus ferralitis]MDF2254748.1 hypothetical protein [Streptantibioticus ferralitis]